MKMIVIKKMMKMKLKMTEDEELINKSGRMLKWYMDYIQQYQWYIHHIHNTRQKYIVNHQMYFT